MYLTNKMGVYVKLTHLGSDSLLLIMRMKELFDSSAFYFFVFLYFKNKIILLPVRLLTSWLTIFDGSSIYYESYDYQPEIKKLTITRQYVRRPQIIDARSNVKVRTCFIGYTPTSEKILESAGLTSYVSLTKVIIRGP